MKMLPVKFSETQALKLKDLVDVVGIDTADHCTGVMSAGFPTRMQKLDNDPVSTLYSNERYGQKNGKGFYDYDGKNKSLWPGLDRFAIDGIQEPQPPVQDVIDRLLYSQAIEAARTMAEEIVHDPREADLGSIFGWGFPPFTGGVLSFIDTVGPDKFVQRADELAEKYGPQFEVPQMLREMAASDKRFYAVGS